jgi:anaerobic C4-dicarboxylate transporter
LLEKTAQQIDYPIVMFLSVIITVGLITYFYNGGQIIVSKRFLNMDGAIRLFPIGVLVAALCVLLSRIDGFLPGIIYGIYRLGYPPRRH